MHCITQWGGDFRPEYSKLGELRTSTAHSNPALVLPYSVLEYPQGGVSWGIGLSQVCFRSEVWRRLDQARGDSTANGKQMWYDLLAG